MQGGDPTDWLLIAGMIAAAVMLSWVAVQVRARQRRQAETENELKLAREEIAQSQIDLTAATWDWQIPLDELRMTVGWARILGEPDHESSTSIRALSARVHPDDLQSFESALQDALSGRASHYEAEHRVRRADGEYAWIVSRGRVVERDAGGSALRMKGRSRDISARKRAEIATREHDERMKLALETAGMVSWSCEAGADRPVWHDPPDSILGPAPAGGHPDLHDAVHPEDLARFLRSLERAMESGEAWRDQYRVTRSDGKGLWVSVCGQPHRGSDGRTSRVIGVMQDVSDIRQAEQALRDSESQLRLLTDAVPAVITYTDASEHVRFANKALPGRLGIPMERILGQSMQQLFGEEIYGDLRPYILRALAGETVRFERVQRLPHGGNADIAVNYVPRRGPGGQVDGFYALITDISELKRLDRMKSEFVSTVSHELRTPLTSIRGSLGLLSGGVAGALPDKARGLVDIAKNNCERLIRLINDILDIEKIESGTIVFALRLLDLGEVIDQALKSNEGYASQHQVRLRLVASVEHALVSADQDRLIQVMTNLISNACKFSPAGGSVDIAVTREDGSFKVAVIDHGPGISEEFRKRIFQRFSQADSSDSRQKGGTGLGLSISKAIVERLGGRIGFDSEQGKGTTFHFSLPARVETAPASLPAEGHPEGRPRILIVEDDADVGRLLQLLLDNAGFDSHIARTAAEARSLAGKIGYAAMTVDLRLPDQDGLALVRSLRSEPGTRDLPVVVVSAYSEEGRLKLGAENLGVVDWLAKPIDEARLIANLRQSTAHGGRLRLLHVEDDADVRRIVAAIAGDFADCEAAETLAQAKARLDKGVFDVILLDIGLPDGSGWELLPMVSRLVPRPRVVIFSAQNANDEANALVQAVLVKSLTSEAQLVEILRNLAMQEA